MNNTIKEYLVALGIKDDFSGKLDKSLRGATVKVKQFAKGASVAGGVVGSLFMAANTGIAKFATNLVKADDELEKYAKSIGKSKDEAFALKSALDAMGKSMEEIEQSEELSRTFRKLQKDASVIKPPDLSEGLNQVREMQGEFARLKQSGTYVAQWIGHYLFKYLQHPMEKINDTFKGLNDAVITNLPKWSEKIGFVMASIVKLGMTIVHGAGLVFNSIKKIFDMIPKEIEIVASALGLLELYIQAGPIGKLIAIFTVLLLLFEDFFVFLDGGESLLGGFWQKLLDIWNLLKDSGAIDKLKENFQKALDFISKKIIETKDYVKELFEMFKESGSLQKFCKFLEAIGNLLLELSKPISKIGKDIMNAFGGIGGSGKPILEWFIQKGLPSFIDFLTKSTQKLTDIIAKLNELGVTEKVIKGLLISFLGFKALKGTTSILNKFARSITLMSGRITASSIIFRRFLSSINIVGAVRSVGIAFGGLGRSIWGIIRPLGIVGRLFMANPFLIWIAAIASLVGIFTLLFKNKEKVQEFVDNIGENIKGFVEIVKDIVGKFAEILPDIIDTVMSLLDSIISAISKHLPKIVQAGIEILTALISGIISVLPKLIKIAIKFLQVILQAVMDNFPVIIKAGLDIITALIDGIVKALPKLIDMAITLISSIIETIVSNIPTVIDAGIKIIMALVKGLISVLPTVIDTSVQLMKSLIGAILKSLPMIIETGTKILSAVIKSIVTTIVNLIKSIFSSVINWFADIWNNIKNIFSESDSYFGQVFALAMRAIEASFGNVINFFKMVWENIKLIFSVVKSVLSGNFGDAYESVVRIWDNVAEFFTHVIDNIKYVFAPIVNWFKEKADDIVSKFMDIPNQLKDRFANAVEKIKSVFAPLVDWFDDKVGKIKGFFNGIGDVVNNVKNWVGDKVNPVGGKLKGYADGGIVTQHQIAEVAEGNKPEVIIPLTKPARAKELLSSAMNYLGVNNTDNLAQKMDNLAQLTVKSVNMLNSLSAGLNQSTEHFYNTTNNTNSIVNKNTYDMHSNFTIHDTSGRPEAVANAVDRTIQMRLRNSQGVFG